MMARAVRDMLKLRAQNFSVADIAKQFGVSRQTVYTAIKRDQRASMRPPKVKTPTVAHTVTATTVLPTQSRPKFKLTKPFSMAAMQGGDPYAQLRLAASAQYGRGRI